MIQVSAIVPVFNGESTIAAAIDSALNQNFDATEVIVVNDGSTDGTALILRSYGSKIRVIEQSNRGLSAARNAGAAIARGEYLAFLDADDEWLPGKLLRPLPFPTSSSSVRMVLSANRPILDALLHWTTC